MKKLTTLVLLLVITLCAGAQNLSMRASKSVTKEESGMRESDAAVIIIVEDDRAYFINPLTGEVMSRYDILDSVKMDDDVTAYRTNSDVTLMVNYKDKSVSLFKPDNSVMFY